MPKKPTMRTRWDEHYRCGPTPWDTGVTPPEVRRFWQEHTPAAGNRALDLGCGTGLNVLFLASLGLYTVGVDIAGLALLKAQHRRADAPSLAGSADFVLADVSQLPLAGMDGVYTLDIGCLHGLPLERRPAYAQGVVRNLRPGGYYHLFAFDRQQRADGEIRGMANGEVAALFGPQLRIVSQEPGSPQPHPCHWYLLQKV